MRSWLSNLGIVLVFSLTSYHVMGQDGQLQSVCRIDSASQGNEKLQLTGFKVKGVDGIYTALHGVHGQAKIDAIFHDPKTRRVTLKISKVDIDRDVALLVPANDSDRLPNGGLALGVWPSAKNLAAQLQEKPCRVIGFPMGIDLLAASTQLTLRRPPISRLTDLLNSGAREEIKTRTSPNSSAQMLSLQGPFLPGHSGAPVLDADDAVIGVGIGGLGEGRVGHGWAAPFHDLNLVETEDAETKRRLATIPTHRIGSSLFLVVDDRIRKAPQGNPNNVSTTVESTDGGPVMSLRKLPSKELEGELNRIVEILEAMKKGDNDKFSPELEFKRISQNRPTLANGTAVEILGDAQEVTVVNDAKSKFGEALGGVNQMYTQVKVLEGTFKGESLWVQSASIRRRTDSGVKPRRKYVLNNSGSATLVLKSIGENPLFDAAEPANHLGVAMVGTEVQMLEETKEANPVIVFRKIEILSGPLKGKTGWVSQNSIQETESLLPSPGR